MKLPKMRERVTRTVGQLPQDDRCSSSEFASAHPTLCPNAQRLVLKPESAIKCLTDGTLQFRTYLSALARETEVTTGLTYSSSNVGVITIDAAGLATLVSAGVATVSVSYGTASVFAQVTVMAGATCCDAVAVNTVFVLDTSRSMSLPVGLGMSRLDLARQIAYHMAGQLNAAKDQMAVVESNESPRTLLTWSATLGDNDTEDTIRWALDQAVQTERLTNLWAGVQHTLDFLVGANNGKQVIVLFSDGEQRPLPSVQEQQELLDAAEAFKQEGGIFIVIGVLASGDGYALLRDLASGGYFINVNSPLDVTAFRAVVQGAISLQGFYCGGSRPFNDNYEAGDLPVGQSPYANPPAEIEWPA